MKNLLYFLFAVLFLGNAIAQDKGAVGTVGPVKFSGLMFGDLFYNVSAIDAANKDVNGFNFRRIYITTDYAISEQFSSRFRIESAITNGQNIGVFVKDAWLSWKNIFKGSNLVVGMSPTPAFDVSESEWGYRSLEKTIMDYFGIVSSRDIGIDLMGKFNESGSVKYWLKIGSGSGNKPESNKYKRYYGMIQFNPSPNFLITFYGDYNSMPQKKDLFDGQMKNNSAIVVAGFIDFKQGKTFALGVEGFLKSQQNNFSANGGALTSQSGFGLSVWAKGLLSDNIGIVGRYDTYDPNTDSGAKNDTQGLIIAALDFKVDLHVSIMPGVEVNTLQGTDNSDVTPRVTFYWGF
jgi:hypothetical protein